MHNRKVKSSAIYYAKILIAISIALFIYGIFLNVSSRFDFYDPIDDTTIINQEENTVSITTSDGSEVVPGNTIVNTDDGNQSNNNSKKSIPSGNSESRNSTLSSIEQINEQLRNTIEKTYDLDVLYGDETKGYKIPTTGDDINTVPISDPNIINTQLNHLKEVLDLYPKGLFREIKNGGIPLTVLLINNYVENNSITGITDSSYSYAHISIAAVHPFEESFYHESYHYIERYMFKLGANFNSWNSLNPEGFTWGTILQEYSYSNTFKADVPFVNNYAQSSPAEDRASTFEYMMAPTKASCLNTGTTVWRKANYMAKTMEVVLDTVSPNVKEYWERYL